MRKEEFEGKLFSTNITEQVGVLIIFKACIHKIPFQISAELPAILNKTFRDLAPRHIRVGHKSHVQNYCYKSSIEVFNLS